MLRIVMLLLFLLSVPVVTAQEADTPLDYVQYKLENGLDVILVEDHTAPTVAVNIWYDVGGADDQAGLTGFAHLFEHMMFQGSAHIAKGEYFERVSEVGGSANAYTSRENTSYYSSLPAHYLPLALWMEADRMASLDVNAENLENQRSVVLEEYQQNYSNQPYTEVVEALRTETFDYEPYRNLVIGEPEDVLSASLENVVEFHELYYVPNNATLVVAGDIDVDTTRQLIDDYFSQIPASDPPPQLPAYIPEESDGEVRETFQDPFASVPGVFIAWSVPPRSDDDYVALEVLARVLSYGNSSRLVQDLQDTGQALAASTLLEGNVGPSLFGLYALPNFNVSVEDIEQALYDELDKIAAEGVPLEELEKVINLTLSSRIIQLETAAGLAESVQDAYFYFDDPDAVYTEIDRLSEVTSEDIQRVIEEYLSEDGRHVYTVEPGGEPPVALEDIEPVEIDTDFEVPPPDVILTQSEPPEPLPISEFTLPEIEDQTLDNGLEVIVIHQPGLPIVSLDLYLPGGSSLASNDLAGLSSLTASVITKGTETRSAQEIAGSIEQVGGFMGASSSRDSFLIGLLALRDDMELGFDLLSDVTFNPTFPEEAFQVEQDSFLTGLETTLADPASLASRAFSTLVYGDHPYGAIPTQETVQSITRDDLVNYYESLRNPDGALLFVTGDLSYAEVEPLVQEYFGEWPDNGEAASVAYEQPASPEGQQIYLVNRPGSTQAQFAIGNLAIDGDAPERQAVSVMSGVLGGSATSRLFRNVREDKGYTYGIYSSVSFPVDQGTFVVAGSAGNDTAALALQEILTELESIQTAPVSAEELDQVKSSLIGSFALRLETYQDFIDTLASLRLRGLPISVLSDYLGDVEVVDVEAVQAAAQEVIHLDNLVIVVVGDAEVLESGLAEIAPVSVIEPR